MDSITTGLAASSILEGTKFKIQQSIPSGSIKRGPHAIVRTADLNDGINIQRRFAKYSNGINSLMAKYINSLFLKYETSSINIPFFGEN
uniref:Transformer minor male splice variant M2 n=1 Tax=Lucilia cuprina TaxID=7375 RepID=C5HJZ0_LUCCU|nr:transformer minor male splice variant M2 [Lucilia cuprina]